MKLRRVLVALAVVFGVLSIGTATSSAQSSCSDVHVAPGVILVTPTPTFGPHPVSVPAGTYRLIVTSFDLGHAPGIQLDQTNEIWSFTTDTGYTSPRTPDLPDALTSETYDLGEATFASDISSITFNQWGVLPSYDSVRPEILFQCVSSASTTAPPTTVAPTTAAPTTTSPGAVAPTTVAPTTTEGVVLPTSVVPAPTTPPETGGTLPRTGSNTVLAWGGLGLLAVGAVWMFTGRVSEEMVSGQS